MAKKTVKESFLTFPAEEKQLEDIRSSVSNVLQESELSVKDKNSVLLAIEEVCTNVIRHAYLYGPGSIRIKIRIQQNKILFSVFDRGRKFDYDHSDTPDLKRYIKTGRKGGLGLYLIRKLMDKVTYHSKDGENELRMEKIVDKSYVQPAKPIGVSIRFKFSLWSSLLVFIIIVMAFVYVDNRSNKATYDKFFRASSDAMETFTADLGEKVVFKNLDVAKLASAWLDANGDFFSLIVTDTSSTIIADPLIPRNFLSDYTPYPENYYNSHKSVTDTLNTTVFHYKKPILLTDKVVGFAYFALNEQPLLDDISRARKGFIIIGLACLLFGFIAVFGLSNYFVKPIQKLTEGVLRIGDGNLEQSLPVEGADEFSEIARAFNEITGKFKKSQENLVEQERLQKEMQVAQEIQHALLPREFPDVEGYDISTIYRAAKDVGGDYFDFVQIDKDTLGIVVADVSGKGVPGSLVMTMIRTALRLESRGNFSPTNILSKVNKFVADDVKKGMFITIFLITLNSATRTITYTSAGHNPMILYRKDSDACYFLNTRGIPLGISLPDEIKFEDTIENEKVQLKKDDILILYTDGITEAMNNAGAQYGNDRLIEFIKTNSDLHPEEFSQKLDDDINRFTSGAPQNDDITLVAIKEKIMLDEIIFEKRRNMIDLVERGEMTPELAAKESGVSVSTFYKYHRRWKEHGDSGLLNKKLRADVGIKQLSYYARKELLNIVREHPELGVKKLYAELSRKGINDITERVLYEELGRMRLNTKKLRLEYVEKMGTLTPEMKDELEKEFLREKEKQKKTSREEHLEQFKKSFDEKKKDEIVVASEQLEKLKSAETLLGDTSLYSEISSELSKLGGGKDLAGMFEKLIVKMAETSIDQIDEESKVESEEAKLSDEIPKEVDTQADVDVVEPVEEPRLSDEIPRDPADARYDDDELQEIEEPRLSDEIPREPDEPTLRSDLDPVQNEIDEERNLIRKMLNTIPDEGLETPEENETPEEKLPVEKLPDEKVPEQEAKPVDSKINVSEVAEDSEADTDESDKMDWGDYGKRLKDKYKKK